MYGACELVIDERVNKKIVVHNLLRRYQVWDGSADEAEKYLENQIVVEADDGQAQDLSSPDNIIHFLNQHSQKGKHVREIEEIGETLSAKLYKISAFDEEVVIKVPKKIPAEQAEKAAFLDIIYQTQLMQFLKDGRENEGSQFFPSVGEEIFIVNPETHTVLNYIAFVDFAQTPIINMLDGPATRAQNNQNV